MCFKKFDDKKQEYFELIDSDVMSNYFLDLDSNKLNEFATVEGLFGKILKLLFLIISYLLSFCQWKFQNVHGS